MTTRQDTGAEPVATSEVAAGEVERGQAVVSAEPLSDEAVFLVADGQCSLSPSEATRVAAELAILRDRCRNPGPLSFTERSLIREVCHDLINRAMRVEREAGGGEIPMYPDAGADERAKETAIRKLLGEPP